MLDDNFKISLSEYLPLRDVVFNSLRDAIIKGKLKPGERLMEKQLAEKLGVSRTPIREAIRKLELEGLVVMVPRKGAQVTSITEKEIQDVLEVRAALEELSARLACEKMNDQDIKNLEHSVEEFNKALKLDDLDKLVEIDINFHDIIFKSTGNEKLQQIVSNLREQLFRYRFAYLKNIEYRKSIREEHEEIVSSIKNRDVNRAGEVIFKHIKNQEKNVIQMMKEEVKRTEKK